jgi:hypothetical protein
MEIQLSASAKYSAEMTYSQNIENVGLRRRKPCREWQSFVFSI